MQKQSTQQRLMVYLQKVGVGGIIIRMVLLWFISAFILYPNARTIINVVYREGEFTLGAFRKLFSSSRAVNSLVNSFLLAASMVVTVNITGTLLVLITEYFHVRGSRILNIIFQSTLVYQGIVLCSGYKFIYGERGIITALLLNLFPNLNPAWFVGYGAVLFVMTFACTSNHMIFLKNALRGIDYQTVEAAKNMGASNITIFFRIIFPVLKPNYMALTVLTFLTGITATSAPLLLGGDRFQTINPMIIAFAKTTVSRDIATLLAVILGMCTVVLLTITNRIEKGGNYVSVSKVKTHLTKEHLHNPILNAGLHILSYLLGLIYAMPIVFVVLYSFTDSSTILSGRFRIGSLTLQNYINVLSVAKNLRPFLISVGYALAAAIIITILVTSVSRIIHKNPAGKFTKVLEYLMMIPWFLPGTLIALGLMLTYDKPQWMIGNKVLIGTMIILLIAYVVLRIPFSLRMVKASFFSLDNTLEESAQSMGSKSYYTFLRVVLPIIFPVLISVIILNFIHLMSEYDMTVFLYHPLYEPLSPVIRAASSEAASLDAKAMSFVYSVLLMIVCSLALFFSNVVQSAALGNKRKGR